MGVRGGILDKKVSLAFLQWGKRVQCIKSCIKYICICISPKGGLVPIPGERRQVILIRFSPLSAEMTERPETQGSLSFLKMTMAWLAVSPCVPNDLNERGTCTQASFIYIHTCINRREQSAAISLQSPGYHSSGDLVIEEYLSTGLQHHRSHNCDRLTRPPPETAKYINQLAMLSRSRSPNTASTFQFPSTASVLPTSSARVATPTGRKYSNPQGQDHWHPRVHHHQPKDSLSSISNVIGSMRYGRNRAGSATTGEIVDALRAPLSPKLIVSTPMVDGVVLGA